MPDDELVATTTHLPRKLYERLRLHVYTRKMLEPQISQSKVIAQALREYFDRQQPGKP